MDEHAKTNYMLAAHGDIWAIHPERMRAYLGSLIVTDMDPDEMEARTEPRTKASRGALAILPLVGPITQRAGLFTAFFGGTSTEKWGRVFREYVDDPNVGGIVIDVDSPGGTVDGVPELADTIFKARGTKPIVAVANTWAASAAYWIATAADELVVTPSGEVGSIGVWSMHVDQSKALEEMGFDVTLISAGKYKTEANPYEPLTEEAKADAQKAVDRYYGDFVSGVARHRGVTATAVRKDFGEGRMVGPKEAVAVGMADRVATLEQTVKRMGGSLADVARAELATIDREQQMREFEAALHQDVVIPPNPPGGSGKGIGGTWNEPVLDGFTSESWEGLSDSARRRIGRHYGYYLDLETFAGLKLPHHFLESGKPSAAGARNALARLPQTGGIPEGDRSKIQAHLRAHLPD